MSGDVLFVGSIPFATAEEVLRDFGPAFGQSLVAMPDGEVGPRSHWTSRVHYAVFANHPDFEIVRYPQKDDGVERLNPHSAADCWQFRIRPGIENVEFGDKGWRLGYARDAVNSYFIFRALRQGGLYPQNLRFQVSIPSVNSAVAHRIFVNRSDVGKVRKGYTEAVKAEIEKIATLIPQGDLAIQIDCATELQDAYGGVEGFSANDAVERNVGQIEALAASIPANVHLGFHMCFGTLGGWPRFEPEDMSGAVRMANAFIDASRRRVDWMHIPLLARMDERFYQALGDLRPQGARIFLGLVHNLETLEERLKLAKKFVPDFGLAAYCGFGRLNPTELEKIKQDHRRALEMLAAC